VKPAPFRYLAPRTPLEACAALAAGEGNAKLLAGGQSLVPMLNFRLLEPAMLIDINRLPGLDAIEAATDAIHIGALVRHRVVETSPLIAERLPIVAEALRHVAHFGVRNRGTIAGSLAHADPAAEWPMLARLLDATLTVQSTRGTRTVSAHDLCVAPLSTSLASDDLILRVTLPCPPAGTGWSFEEVSRRPGDFAMCAVAILMERDGPRCRNVRIALAGVGGTPVRARKAEATLAGRTFDDAAAADAAGATLDDCTPQTDLHGSAEYRMHLIEHLVRRGLVTAWQRTR